MFFNKKIKFNKEDLHSVIRACSEGDDRAQRELLAQFYNYGSSVCRLYSKSEEECDEMVNDGFLKVLHNIQKYDYSRPFKTWLRSVFINSCIDYFRKYHQHSNIISLEQINDVEVDIDIISALSADELMLLVAKLPDACRMNFILYVVDGYKHKEIGDMLGIQEGTSKSNLRDARIKLKKLLLMEYGVDFYIPNTSKIKS